MQSLKLKREHHQPIFTSETFLTDGTKKEFASTPGLSRDVGRWCIDNLHHGWKLRVETRHVVYEMGFRFAADDGTLELPVVPMEPNKPLVVAQHDVWMDFDSDTDAVFFKMAWF